MLTKPLRPAAACRLGSRHVAQHRRRSERSTQIGTLLGIAGSPFARLADAGAASAGSGERLGRPRGGDRGRCIPGARGAQQAIAAGFDAEALYAVSMPRGHAGSIYLLFDTSGGPRTIDGDEARA